jgi:DNA-binding XRE family transcriptional regulator
MAIVIWLHVPAAPALEEPSPTAPAASQPPVHALATGLHIGWGAHLLAQIPRHVARVTLPGLRAARVAAGLSQERLGLPLGIEQQSIGAWERQTARCPVPVAAILAEKLGVSLQVLIAAASPARREGRP